MQDHEDDVRPIEIIAVLKESFSLYQHNFSLFSSLSLAAYAMFLLEQAFALLNISFGWVNFIIFWIGYILMFWATAALIFAVSKRYRDEDIAIKQSFVETKDKLWRFAGVSILGSLIYAVGFFLLILPGVYWGTIFALAGTVLILEDTAFFKSFKRSRELIEGHFWPVLGIYFLFCLIALLGWFLYRFDISFTIKTLLIYLLSILLAPWWIVVNISIYQRLKAVKGEAPQEQGQVKKGVGCLGCLGIIGLGLACLLLSVFWIANFARFAKTEQGAKIYEWVARQVSPRMEFPDGVTLNRPEGYMAFGGQDKGITTYVLFSFGGKNPPSFSVSSIPYAKLNIADGSSVKLEDEVIWNKYSAYLTENSPADSVAFKSMEKGPLQMITVAGKPWGQYVFYEKGKEDSKFREVWMYNYTLSKGVVIFVVCQYTDKSFSQEDVNKILSSFIFNI